MKYRCYASAAFGMEGLVSSDLRKLGVTGIAAENGGVRFAADAEQLYQCNLYLHFCERVFLILAEDDCDSFDRLFHLVHGIDWNSIINGDESIDISCKCSRSRLMSPRDCQSISKKAIIEKVRAVRGQNLFPESGSSLQVHISIRNNHTLVLLNTSGAALSRRGYRTWNGEAPIRETLASALIELSGWQPGQPLHDPCCGTGTILTEAAFIAADRAPGLDRSFAMENYRIFQNLDFHGIRTNISGKADLDKISGISGSDIDPGALELARRHILQAGLPLRSISLSEVPLQDLVLNTENGVFICNPPYGERLNDQKQCRLLYRDLFFLKQRHPTWKLCAISSDPAFERSFGKRADKKRRLYNGRLECVLYIYY